MIALIDNCTGEIKDSAFSSSETVDLTITNSDLEFGDSTFAYNDKLKNLTFGDGTYKLGEYAFYKNKKLTGAIIGGESEDNKFELGDSAFSSCEKLASVKIGNGEYEIDDSCFAYCDSLSKVEISDNAEVEFGSDVFYKCADDLDIAYGKKHYNADTVEDAF